MLRYALFALLLAGQSNLHAQRSLNDSLLLNLEEPSKKMLEFADMNMGKKIGNGICASFVNEAMGYATGKAWWSAGRKIDLKRELIQPGDVLYMRWYKRKRGKATQSHVAVVIEVIEPHIVMVAHQNFNNQKFVVETRYDLNQKIRAGRRVEIYRPEENSSQ